MRHTYWSDNLGYSITTPSKVNAELESFIFKRLEEIEKKEVGGIIIPAAWEFKIVGEEDEQ